MENCVGAAETWWVWTGGSTSSKDTCSEIWGDGIDAAVKDGAAIVRTLQLRVNLDFKIFIYNHNICYVLNYLYNNKVINFYC